MRATSDGGLLQARRQGQVRPPPPDLTPAVSIPQPQMPTVSMLFRMNFLSLYDAPTTVVIVLFLLLSLRCPSSSVAVFRPDFRCVSCCFVFFCVYFLSLPWRAKPVRGAATDRSHVGRQDGAGRNGAGVLREALPPGAHGGGGRGGLRGRGGKSGERGKRRRERGGKTSKPPPTKHIHVHRFFCCSDPCSTCRIRSRPDGIHERCVRASKNLLRCTHC